jgi:DNA-binding PadR family transcriptional regulator
MQISEPAEYVILGLLNSKSMHGYEMFQYFEDGTLGQIIHLEMSQMYAFLKKLERLNYIEAEIELQGSRPPRKIFHLTETGQTVFMNWLVQADEKPRDIRILFLIKLYFVQRFLPTQTTELIKQQIQACEHFLIHLRAKQQALPDAARMVGDAAFFDQIVLNSRIHQTSSLLDWLSELQTELAGAH